MKPRKNATSRRRPRAKRPEVVVVFTNADDPRALDHIVDVFLDLVEERERSGPPTSVDGPRVRRRVK